MNIKKLKNAKRVNLNLDSATDAMLDTLAKDSGKSKSRVIREIIQHGFITKAIFDEINN